MNETEADRERHRQNQVFMEYHAQRRREDIEHEKAQSTLLKTLAEYQDAILHGAFIIYRAEVTALGEPYEEDRFIWDGFDRFIWDDFYSTREKAEAALAHWFAEMGTPTIVDEGVWSTLSFDTTYEGLVLEELVR